MNEQTVRACTTSIFYQEKHTSLRDDRSFFMRESLIREVFLLPWDVPWWSTFSGKWKQDEKEKQRINEFQIWSTDDFPASTVSHI